MSSFLRIAMLMSSSGAAVILDASIKAAVVLLVAAIAARSLQKTSAAVRHRIWSLGLGGALLMPLLSLTVPQLGLPILPPNGKSDQAMLAPERAEPASFASEIIDPMRQRNAGWDQRDLKNRVAVVSG